MSPLPRSTALYLGALLILVALELSLASGHGKPEGVEVWSFFGLTLGQEIVLLSGTWLLARRLFARAEVEFLVSVATVGSTIWVGNSEVELGTTFAVPLMVECILARRWWAAGVAGIAQAIPLPFSLLPVPFLAVAAWFGVGRVEGRGFLLLAPLALSAFWAPVRENAGLRHPGLFLDLFLGLGLSKTGTVFCGFFITGLAIAGVRGREVLRLLLALLSLGSAAAAWGAAAPVGVPWLRLATVLAAGTSLALLLKGDPAVRVRVARSGASLLLASLALGVLSALMVLEHREVEDGLRALAEAPDYFSDVAVLSDLLGASAMGAALAGGGLLLAVSGRRAAPVVLAIILFLHSVDVLGWKSRLTWLRCVRKEGR